RKTEDLKAPGSIPGGGTMVLNRMQRERAVDSPIPMNPPSTSPTITIPVLIANRGEIAIRIARTLADIIATSTPNQHQNQRIRFESLGVFTPDDEGKSLHVNRVDRTVALSKIGAQGYLDIDGIVDAALKSGAKWVHPGYGFLSENADFVDALAKKDIGFVGPDSHLLRLFGDKVRARDLALQCGVPVLKGTRGPTTLQQAQEFFKSLKAGEAMMIKAINGGGGRGIRSVTRFEDVASAFARCQSEALASFGNGDVYVEQMVLRAKHVEVQVIADGFGNVVHLGERECTLQRRNQKLIEITPCPSLKSNIRTQLCNAAATLIKSAKSPTKLPYRGLATVEFLLDESNAFYFMEVNPRLQVEHTVTEELHGVDLVHVQMLIALGGSLNDIIKSGVAGLGGALKSVESLMSKANGSPLLDFSIQCRVNAEMILDNGDVVPSPENLVAVFEPPSGRNVRVDSAGYSGMVINPAFDSMLAKVIITSRGNGWVGALNHMARALGEFRLVLGREDGRSVTNLGFLMRVLKMREVTEDDMKAVTTMFVTDRIRDILAVDISGQHGLLTGFFSNGRSEVRSTSIGSAGKTEDEVPVGCIAVKSPLVGTVVSLDVKPGDLVKTGSTIAVVLAMKMENVIPSPQTGIIHSVVVKPGTILQPNQAIVFIKCENSNISQSEITEETVDASSLDLDKPRKDLQELLDRNKYLEDPSSTTPKSKGRKPRIDSRRTARQLVTEDLFVEGSFMEYGALAVAAQRGRRDITDLIQNTPADGLVCGIGEVVTDIEGRFRCGVFAYDFTVLAGTQGFWNHRKLDRLLGILDKWRLPLVCFCEGGGGRPGDVDTSLVSVAGLELTTFALMAGLSGKVPMVGVASGKVFAGNAALLACCDVVIATRDSNIGMGGPAMIEGGGLGVFKANEIGPSDVQSKNGVIDILVETDLEGVAVAKKYLSYFLDKEVSVKEKLGKVPVIADQRILRHLVPENRRRTYDMRRVLQTIFDADSVLELQPTNGVSMITCLARIDNMSVGVIANNPSPIDAAAGAIDGPGAKKATQFIKLCDTFGIPIVSICDTPGFLVGPDAEKTGQAREFGRLFVQAAKVSVPFVTVVIRKGVGLGAMAMAGGSFHATGFTISWPTGEFSGMGIEGAVRLGFKKELDKIKDSESRQKLFETMVAKMHEHGKAMNIASYLEIDAVIDPIETRSWICRGLRSFKCPSSRL
ncbi:hypothetical protein HDU76_003019, partial [Blyttiomyces sp. JEL0837]